MSPRGRRIGWWVAIGAAQLGLVYLAGKAVTHRTIVPWGGWGIPSSTGQYIFYGWPLVWSEYQQQGDRIGLTILPGPPIRYDSGPIEFKGRNWAVPVLMFTLAASLPPVVADLFSRRRGPDGARPGPSRSIRLSRATILGAVFGLTAVSLELETETHVFHVTGSGGWTRGGYRFGPTYFLDRTIFHYRNQPGTPYPISGSEWYREANSRLCRYRQDLTGHREGSWPFRTRLTLYATGVGLLMGCLAFRPWRRAAGPAAAPGAAATTPPAA